MIRSTFAIPIVLALLNFAGLIVALTGDGWRDLLAWSALFVPLASVIWAMARQFSSKDSSK